MAATGTSRNPPLEASYDETFPLPLLLTKLYRPRADSGLEQRLRLLEHLDDNAPRTLTLISAPAGYGKTTLASTWLQASDRRSAWVSLDERDDDLLIFTAYLLAAISRDFPNLEFRTQTLLRSSLAPSASTLARYLTNDLDRITEPFVLVLDDIHQVRQQAIFDLARRALASSATHDALGADRPARSPTANRLLAGTWAAHRDSGARPGRSPRPRPQTSSVGCWIATSPRTSQQNGRRGPKGG